MRGGRRHMADDPTDTEARRCPRCGGPVQFDEGDYGSRLPGAYWCLRCNETFEEHELAAAGPELAASLWLRPGAIDTEDVRGLPFPQPMGPEPADEDYPGWRWAPRTYYGCYEKVSGGITLLVAPFLGHQWGYLLFSPTKEGLKVLEGVISKRYSAKEAIAHAEVILADYEGRTDERSN